MLALLGADVVQIESRTRPDVWRGAGRGIGAGVLDHVPDQDPLNCNGMYNAANFNKRAITLDMASEEGLKMFWDMVGNFDVVVDNFAPHVMAKWGITLESLHAIKPSMIFASVSAFGTEGPLAPYPGNGNTTEPMAGLAALNGYEDGPACNTGGLIPDPISGYYLASSILAALVHAKRTGVGQRVSGAMLEAVACTCPSDAVAEFSVNGVVRGPCGNSHPRHCPHGMFGASGEHEWIAVAAESDAAWAALAQRMGVDDPRFATEGGRKAHEEEINAIVSGWCATKDPDAEAAALAEIGVSAARVQAFFQSYLNPSAQWVERGFLEPVTHPECGTHMMPTTPWVLGRTPAQPVSYSPLFGEHCEEVFAQELGIGPEEFKRLEADGVTGDTFLGLKTAENLSAAAAPKL